MEPTQAPSPSGEGQRTTAWLLRAGLVPLPWFLIWVTLGGLVLPGYSALAQHGSELTLHPGWPRVFLDVAALGSGAGFCLFSIGLWRSSGRSIAWGALTWFGFGLAMMSNGIWPMGQPMHGLYAIGLMNLVAPGLSLLEAGSLREDRLAHGVTVLVSLAGVLYLWLNLTGHDPEGFRGLTQRLFSSVNALWPATIAYLYLGRHRQSSR